MVLHIRLDEAARVVVDLRVCRNARGACRPTGAGTKRTTSLAAGPARIALRHARRSGLPRPGRYELRLVATDADGNRGAARRFVLRIVSTR